MIYKSGPISAQLTKEKRKQYVFWRSEKQATVAAITSSFDTNFCPVSDFFKCENKLTRDEIWRKLWMEQHSQINLTNLAVVTAQACRKLSWWKSTYFFARWGCLFCNSASILYLVLCITPCQSGSGLFLCILWSTFAELRLFLGLWCILVTLKKQHRNSRLCLNSVKHCCEVISRLRLLYGVDKRGTHSINSFLMTNMTHVTF